MWAVIEWKVLQVLGIYLPKINFITYVSYCRNEYILFFFFKKTKLHFVDIKFTFFITLPHYMALGFSPVTWVPLQTCNFTCTWQPDSKQQLVDRTNSCFVRESRQLHIARQPDAQPLRQLYSTQVQVLEQPRFVVFITSHIIIKNKLIVDLQVSFQT